MKTFTKVAALRSDSKVAVKTFLPDCQAKAGCPNKARIDCKSWDGRWGYTCARCWPSFALRPNTLGLGIGQYLLLTTESDIDLPTWVHP